jgi:23S rRNA (adenine2030-N6)-methyltransferase
MNYRHAFHAGNFADVVKHVVLLALVESLKKKPAPFLYLDTHAGAGVYDLSHAVSQRSGEYRGGIARLLDQPRDSLPPEVAAYVAIVRASAGAGHSAITAYPGSPAIVRALRRAQDRMVLVEKNPREVAALRTLFARQKRVAVIEGDGYQSLKAHLPPAEHRSLVLIDPPYESEREFDEVLTALEEAHRLWPPGVCCVWYPVTQRAGADTFRGKLRGSGIRKVLDVTFYVLPDDSQLGMPGCGLMIVNPPWQLDERLREVLPALQRRLAVDGAGRCSVNWLVAE